MSLKLHNAMWPGLVGKGEDDNEPPIGFDEMLDLTCAAEVNGQRFDGVDLFLFDPHLSIDAERSTIVQLADNVGMRNLAIGSLVAPVWIPTNGGSAMGTVLERRKFLTQVRKACSIARQLDDLGVRKYGVVRIDSAAHGAAALEEWLKSPEEMTWRIAATFREAAIIAAGYGQKLAAEGEICWAGMHTLRAMNELLETVDMPGSLGFQADLAHTYLYALGYNGTDEDVLLKPDYTQADFDTAYAKLVNTLAPWTIDFHVAQNDGTVHGTGSHDKTGRHCVADDPNGKLDIVACSKLWLAGAEERGIYHSCWDGCMFPNSTLRKPETWNTILAKMIQVRDALVA